MNKTEATLSLAAKSGLDLAAALRTIEDLYLFDNTGKPLVDDEWIEEEIEKEYFKIKLSQALQIPL